jgi:hypothetical protein
MPQQLRPALDRRHRHYRGQRRSRWIGRQRDALLTSA